MDDRIELLLLSYGLDGLCAEWDINPLHVVKLLIEEGLIDGNDINGLIEEDGYARS